MINTKEKIMISSEQIDEITSKIKAALPSGINSNLKSGIKQFQQETEKNIRVVLQASFAKLDLVSREEFDIQSKLLQRTREKLSELEQRVQELNNVKKS
jgi:BMFP domain-containing protein YqiC